MGRGVNYLNDATRVAYFSSLDLNYDLDEWFDVVDEFRYAVTERFTSLDYEDRWDNQETKIILENGLVEVGISEYCGVVSLSVRPNQEVQGYHEVAGLAERWLDQCWDNICGLLSLPRLGKLGTFSNGESVYELIGC